MHVRDAFKDNFDCNKRSVLAACNRRHAINGMHYRTGAVGARVCFRYGRTYRDGAGISPWVAAPAAV